jgi:hypothetical protein
MTARSSRKGKSKYKIKNWPKYNESLVNRGGITFWISEDIASSWYHKVDSKKEGGQKKYTDIAIQTSLTMRLIYSLGLRQTEGFMNSLFNILDLNITSAHYSTLSKRTDSLEIIKESLKKDEPVTILVDSTGLKISGCGEWEEAKHGKGRRKEWRQLHIGVDEETLEIHASVLTDHLTSDPSQLLPLLDQVESEVSVVKADGVYDQSPLRRAISSRGIKSVFPPRKDAVLSKDYINNPTQRDLDILKIEKHGRESWEYRSGYSKRNLVENSMFRYKNNIGSKLRSKTLARQKVEVELGILLLNKMTTLGLPNSVRIR